MFGRADNAIDCAHGIVRAVSVKNRQNKSLPNVGERISIMTSQVIFGIVGEEERKIPTIVSPVNAQLEKVDNICKLMSAKFVFTKSSLDNLSLEYKFLYRHIGGVTIGDKEKTLLFEDLEVLPRDIQSSIVKSKPIFERGVLEYENGNYDAACENFSQALKTSPNDKGCYVYFNNAKEKIGN